jgi:hypothetical protein
VRSCWGQSLPQLSHRDPDPESQRTHFACLRTRIRHTRRRNLRTLPTVCFDSLCCQSSSSTYLFSPKVSSDHPSPGLRTRHRGSFSIPQRASSSPDLAMDWTQSVEIEQSLSCFRTTTVAIGPLRIACHPSSASCSVAARPYTSVTAWQGSFQKRCLASWQLGSFVGTTSAELVGEAFESYRQFL